MCLFLAFRLGPIYMYSEARILVVRVVRISYVSTRKIYQATIEGLPPSLKTLHMTTLSTSFLEDPRSLALTMEKKSSSGSWLKE